MNRMNRLACLCLLLCLALPAWAQRRDPLSPAEVDQIRESKDDPPRRMKLYIKFTQQRVDALTALLHAEKPPADRARQVCDQLEDFTELSDEVADNLEMFQRYRDDLHKAMKEVTDAYGNWRIRLADVRTTMNASDASRTEFRRCLSALESAEESVDDGAKMAADVSEKQKQMAADAKEQKKRRE